MTTDSAIALNGKLSLAVSVGAFIAAGLDQLARTAPARHEGQHLLADLERQIQCWQGEPSYKKR